MSLDDATQDRFAATAARLAALGEKRIEGLRSRVVDLLDPLGHEIALDVATGTGPFAMALAPLVREVIGVDSVPEMLEEARRLAENVPNVRFVEGSAYELPAEDE
ncbi:MAG: class I SAM-dependent methyltransferase, partial [Gaiellaceae bacterium]